MKPSKAVLSVTLALALLAAPFPSPGQQPEKVYRIGYLGGSLAPTDQTPQHCPIKSSPSWQAWVAGLRERGYLPGQNFDIECRWTEGREERAPALAAELVRLTPDAIVIRSSAAAVAAKQATGTLPIVMEASLDAVREGIVASLARPGGNVTGMTLISDPAFIGKRLQLLQEVLPRAARLAIVPGGRPFARAQEVWLKDTAAALPTDFRTRGVELTVTAGDGLVTVTGWIRWPEVEHAIREVVRRVEGVTEVRPRIVFGPLYPSS